MLMGFSLGGVPLVFTTARIGAFKSRWWLFAAGFIAAGLVVLGIGNLLADDEGPLYGKIVAAAVAVAAAGLVVAGLTTRRHNGRLGSAMIGIGILPAWLLIIFFWFPPVALVGFLAIVVTIAAFNDAASQRRSEQPSSVPETAKHRDGWFERGACEATGTTGGPGRCRHPGGRRLERSGGERLA
jgi:hypothetical protein